MIVSVLFAFALSGQASTSVSTNDEVVMRCIFPRFGPDGRFSGADPFTVLLPKGIGTGIATDVVVSDPSGLMRGGSFSHASADADAFTLTGMKGANPRMFVRVRLDKAIPKNKDNAGLGSLDANDEPRSGRCWFVNVEARKAFELYKEKDGQAK